MSGNVMKFALSIALINLGYGVLTDISPATAALRSAVLFLGTIGVFVVIMAVSNLVVPLLATREPSGEDGEGDAGASGEAGSAPEADAAG